MADEAELARILAQQPRVPLSGVFGPNGEQIYAPPGMPEAPSGVPSWYRDVQPYPVNPRAALEGLMVTAGATGGPAGAVSNTLSQAASSPLARALAGTLGFGSVLTNPTEAGDAGKAAPAGQSVAPTQENLQKLLERQQLLSRQLEDARVRRETERKSGQGPRYQAADQEFRQLNDQMGALNTLIQTEQKKGSPEALLDAEKAQDEFRRQSREKDMNTSVKEMLSDVMPYAPIATGIGAALLGGKIKGSAVEKFNTKMEDLVGRWEQAVNSGNKPLAQALQQEFQTMNKAGPGGTGKALASGAILGELGQLGPVVSDYAKALPGSDLYDKTVKTMTDPWEVAGRVGSGLMWGAGPAEIAALLMGRGAKSPLGFGAETRAMPDPRRLPPPLPPNSPPIEGGPLTPVPGGPGGAGGGSPQALGPAQTAGGVTTTNRELIEALGSPANANAQTAASPPPHTWNDGAGRWQGEGGRFVAGKPPKPDKN